MLITGGLSDAGLTGELYLPSSGLSCLIPVFPDSEWRVGHTQESSGLICGGQNTKDTCIQLSPDTGTWQEVLTLDISRYHHVSWTPGTGVGTYLMGGKDRRKATTLIRPDGTQEPGFPLKYDA